MGGGLTEWDRGSENAIDRLKCNPYQVPGIVLYQVPGTRYMVASMRYAYGMPSFLLPIAPFARHVRYPVDTGLFVSGAMDGVVKLWDTNTLDVVLEFDFQEKVLRVYGLFLFQYYICVLFLSSLFTFQADS